MINILWILILTSLACSIIGVLLLLRNMAMISDAISHSVLLGIVLAFFITHDINSPLLLVGATLFGVLTVYLVEFLTKKTTVKNDDAVGIVYPMFFALAVILISMKARNVHLDTDIVLMGEVTLAPFRTMSFFGMEVPKALVSMGLVFLIDLLFVLIFYKELKVGTFDREFAVISGLSSSLLFYAFMTLTSLTAVSAFDAIGAILVVSFMITPAASAYLWTKKLSHTFYAAFGYAILNSVIGYYLAITLNVSIQGMVAVTGMVSFLLTFLLYPDGLIASTIRRARQKEELKEQLVIIHLGNHRNTEDEQLEAGCITLHLHVNWTREETERVVEKLIGRGLVMRNQKTNCYELTEKGALEYNQLYETYGMKMV